MGQSDTRAAVKERLKAEGRWQTALDYRESLKAEGVPPAEAWRRMAEAFPPLPNGQAAPSMNGHTKAPSPNGTPAPDSPAPRRRRRLLRHQGPICLYLDIMWVYAHLPENTDTRYPPSPGALTLLEWGRRNLDQFIKQFLAKFVTEEGWREFLTRLHYWPEDLEPFDLPDAAWEFVRLRGEGFDKDPLDEADSHDRHAPA